MGTYAELPQGKVWYEEQETGEPTGAHPWRRRGLALLRPLIGPLADGSASVAPRPGHGMTLVACQIPLSDT